MLGGKTMDPCRILADLTGFASVSSTSNTEITGYIQAFLKERQFDTEWLDYTDSRGVRKSSLVAKRGEGSRGFAYFGHSDVVPADDWFEQEVGPWRACRRGDRIYGRGTCDMKGSLACMLAAVDRLADRRLKHPLYIVVTADEEIGYCGARHVQACSAFYKEMTQQKAYGVVGEPTHLEVVYAHKGSYGFVATAYGRAAHSSTREGRNANLVMIPFLQEMKAIYDELESDPQWQDARFDPPTLSWNIGINDYTRATNITAPQSVCTVYFRPMPGQNVEPLLERARSAATRLGIQFQITAQYPPFYRDPQSPFIRELLQLSGRSQPRTVCYGTDACVLTDMEHLAVLGPGSIAQAHTHDEWIAVEQLEAGTELYYRIIEYYCSPELDT